MYGLWVLHVKSWVWDWGVSVEAHPCANSEKIWATSKGILSINDKILKQLLLLCMFSVSITSTCYKVRHCGVNSSSAKIHVVCLFLLFVVSAHHYHVPCIGMVREKVHCKSYTDNHTPDTTCNIPIPPLQCSPLAPVNNTTISPPYSNHLNIITVHSTFHTHLIHHCQLLSLSQLCKFGCCSLKSWDISST